MPEGGRWDLTLIKNTGTTEPLVNIKAQEALVRTGNGNIVVCPSGSNANRLVTSTDEGDTWSDTPTTLPFTISAIGDKAAMWMDANDYLHIIHTDWSPLQYDYWIGTPNSARTDWSWPATPNYSWPELRSHAGQVSIKSFDWNGNHYTLFAIAESYNSPLSNSVQLRILKHTGGVGGAISLELTEELYYSSTDFTVASPAISFRTADGKTIDTAPDFFFHFHDSEQRVYKYTWNGSLWIRGWQRAASSRTTTALQSVWNSDADRHAWIDEDATQVSIYERDLANTTQYEITTSVPTGFTLYVKAAALDRETGDAVIVGTPSTGYSLRALFYDRRTNSWDTEHQILPEYSWTNPIYAGHAQRQSRLQKPYGQIAPRGYDFLISVRPDAAPTQYELHLLRYSMPSLNGWGAIPI